jgi:hypothetical protein
MSANRLSTPNGVSISRTSAGIPVHLAQTQGIDDALIRPYGGHATRQSLEIYSCLTLADAQQRYDDVIDNFPRLTSTVTHVCSW